MARFFDLKKEMPGEWRISHLSLHCPSLQKYLFFRQWHVVGTYTFLFLSTYILLVCHCSIMGLFLTHDLGLRENVNILHKKKANNFKFNNANYNTWKMLFIQFFYTKTCIQWCCRSIFVIIKHINGFSIPNK